MKVKLIDIAKEMEISVATPKFDIRGIIGAHHSKVGNPETMEGNVEEIQKILKLMKMADDITVAKGSGMPVADDGTYEYSEGAKLIVEEALKEDEKPLFVVFMGPITDLACAYLHTQK